MKAYELREKRAKLVTDAQALVPDDMKDFTSELRTKVEAMLADARGLDGMIASFEAEETRAEETRAKSLNLSNTGASETVEQEEVRKAFRSYLRTGRTESRALTVSADGILIPQFVADPAVAKQSAGQILDIVGKLETATGAPVKVPYWNDLANQWVLNSAGLSTTDPSISSGPTLTVNDYRFNPVLIDNSLVQDAGFDVEGQVVSDISTRYARNFSNYVTNGGTGITALTSITAGTTSTNPGNVTYKDMVTLVSTLDPAYAANATLTWNNNTQGQILQIVDGNGRPIFIPYQSAPTMGIGTVLGYNVKLNQYLPNVGASNVAVQFGDFKAGYTFRTVQGGIMVKVLNELYAAQNQVGYVAFTRVAGAVVDPGSHPILSLTQHS